MAPRTKILCSCGCNQYLTYAREKIHRDRQVKPYVVPADDYPSRQKRIFAPEAEETRNAAAGPSGSHSSDGGDDMAVEPWEHEPPDDSMSEPMDDLEQLNESDEDADPESLSALELGGLAKPEVIMRKHWQELDHLKDFDSGFDFEDDDLLDMGLAPEAPFRNEDSDDEDSDEDPDIFDWDSFRAPGLSAVDQLREEFEREAAMAQKLNAYYLAICRAFAFKVRSNLTDKAFKMTPFAFPQDPPLPMLDGIRSRVNFLAGFKPQIYDCCVNSCLCYVGPHADLTERHYCNEPRLRANGKPRKKFTYIPIIPRLVVFAGNRDMAEKQQYRAEYVHKPGTTSDVFDGEHYRSLRKKQVEINGEKLPHKYFSDPRDVALGASWDGFAPFKRRKKTAWPLILFDYNLPPDLRFLLEFIIALGVIPGPNKPKDSDSFLWPAVQELLQLAAGVRAFDVLSGKLFALRAYLILVFGDIPAVSMFMRVKGHNGISPCRMCKIIGLRISGARGTAHYVPLDRSCHPDVKADPSAVKVYDADDLPLRTHEEIISQGEEVEAAKTTAEAERLAKKYGVKGVPILSYLHSLSFPQSFGYDFMHLIWENLIKNLTLLWTGDFKGLDQGREEYELSKALWEAIASETASASDTIPSAYGSRIPNIAKDRPNVSAEMWSFWTLYLGPVLLRRRFKHIKYYRHFIKLVRLLNLCLKFEISDAEIETIRTGFISWVKTYESVYFQNNVERMSVCPLTIHALLHIAPGIKFCGPVWCYWAFPMERYCGSIQPGIRSRRFPWASIDRYVLEIAQLTQIKTLYNVVQELSLTAPRGAVQGALADELYPSCILLPPRSPQRPQNLRPIAAALSTRTGAKLGEVNAALRTAIIEEWGKVRRIDSEAGDTMRSCSLGVAAEDMRDATYVRYSMLVDEHARFKNRPVKLVLETFFGQLTHIYRIHLPVACPALKTSEPTTYILAAIRACVLKTADKELAGLDIHFYSDEGTFDVVDITTVQALVGRVKADSKKSWAIIDRSGALARPVWLGEDADS